MYEVRACKFSGGHGNHRQESVYNLINTVLYRLGRGCGGGGGGGGIKRRERPRMKEMKKREREYQVANVERKKVYSYIEMKGRKEIEIDRYSEIDR